MAGIVFLVMAYMLSQFYRSFLAVLSPVLSSELGMNTADLSNAAAAWFVVFAVAQFPVGAALDRFGPRRTAAYMLMIGGAGGVALFSVATNATTIIIAMGLIGLGCAPVLMAAFFLFAHNYSEASFATLGATFIGIGSLGNVLGSAPLAFAIESLGWQSVALWLCGITALAAIGIFVVVKDPVLEVRTGKHGSVFDLFKIRELWWIFPIIFMGYGVAAGIRGLWAGPYLADMFGASTSQIGQVTLYMALALVFGSLVFGPMDRIFNTRKWVIIVSNCLVLTVIFWIYFTENKALWQVSLAFVAIGFFGAGYAVQITHGRSFVPKHLIGRGVTLLNFCSIGGAGALQALSGRVVGNAGSSGGTAAGYDALFLFYFVCLSIAVLIYFFSTDKKPRQS